MANLLGNILRCVTRKPATRLYPFVRRPAPLGARGRLEMDVASCTFCGLCQRRCPTNAIVVSRDPKSWTCDTYGCILCGACIEVCPKDCLRFDAEHRPPAP